MLGANNKVPTIFENQGRIFGKQAFDRIAYFQMQHFMCSLWGTISIRASIQRQKNKEGCL